MVSFRAGTRGNDVSIVNAFNKRILDGVDNQFPAKNALDCMIFHIKSQKFFSEVRPADLHWSVPGVWSQTSISAWLASVPIVPALRSDH